MKVPDKDVVTPGEKTLAKIIDALIKFSVTINVSASEQEISEYAEKFCAVFTDKKVFSEVLKAFIIANLRSAEITFAEHMVLWGNLLDNINTSSEKYSFIDYFADIAKVKYLYSCYSDIASHTTEIRKYADELKSTKEDYDRIERILSEPD